MSEAAVRWPRNLYFRDWLALVVVGPLLGWWLMVGSPWPRGGVAWDQDEIRAQLGKGHSWGVTLAGLAFIGVVLALLSPRLRGLAAVSIMAPVTLFVIYDFATQEKSNVVGVLLVLYLMFTGFAVFIGWAFTDILSFFRDRRRNDRRGEAA